MYDKYQYFQASGSSLTTVLRTEPGQLHTVTIDQCTTLGTFAIFDGSGSVGTSPIANVNVPATNLMPTTLTYDVYYKKGLTIQFGTFQGVVTLAFK